jgi:hypothetical protein
MTPRFTKKPYYMTTREFGAKHNITDSRVRQLLAAERIFPAQKIGRAWIIYPNAVIVRPYLRPNRVSTKMLTEAA